MNEQEVIGYSVYVGIDWADSKHDVCICPRDSDTRVFDVIRHCAEAIDDWVKDLHQRYGGRIAIAVELSKGPIVSRTVMSVVGWIQSIRPALVGGCRPVDLLPFLSQSKWRMQHDSKLLAFGISSEVLVAKRR